MPDDALRELERRWRASGALEDGLAWHRARLRAEVVDRDGLRQEAAAGDQAAWLVLDPPPLLVRLDAWLRAHAPEALAAFHPPASEAELDAVEEALGQPLPPLLRALHTWRSGQPPAPWPGLNDGPLGLPFAIDPPAAGDAHLDAFPERWRLLSLRELRAATLGFRGDDPDLAGCLPFMIRRVLGKTHHHRLRCVDALGMGQGVPGQVVEGHAEWIGLDRVVAPSLERWLEVTVAALEQSAWTPDEDDPTRLRYFERAVSPGYPRHLLGDRTAEARAPLAASPEQVESGHHDCFGCLFAVGLLPLVLLVRWVVEREQLPLVVVLASGLWALLALAIVRGLFAHTAAWRRREHARLTAEFAEASLDPPSEEESGA